MRPRRILIIGLDGATFDILDPLLEKGFLPNIKGFIDKGASGCLRSTVPPISAPAWFALATGLRPEKTGVYDFLIRQEEGYALTGLTSASYAERAVWDLLSRAGRQVGILNYPLLRPPYPVKGFMVSGLGAVPGEEFTFPAGLKEELNKIAGGTYEIVLPYSDARYEDVDLFFTDLDRVFRKHCSVTEALIEKGGWDFFWVVFSETDWLQHLTWRHVDEKHSLHPREGSKEHKEQFVRFWTQIDDAIGTFYRIAGPETNVVIVSDHGFGPSDEIFRINAWLELEGYLVRKRRKVSDRAKALVNRFIQGAVLKSSRFHLIPPIFYKWGRSSLTPFQVRALNQIDLERSLAFDPGHTLPAGALYVNDRLVPDPSERKRIAGEIRTRLEDWGKEKGVAVDVWEPGREHPRSPDLIIGMGEWGCVMLKDQFEGPVYEKRGYSSRHSGSHRPNGIFIGFGPDIQAVQLQKIDVYDVAPTVLFMFDEIIPSDMDGRVLDEIFHPDYLKGHPRRIREGDKKGQMKPGAGIHGEEEAFEKQLKDLGYL